MTDNAHPPYLTVRDLQTHFFGDEGVTRAVDGATFDVHPGKTLGIVGESGCGKSVTARSILRIVERPGRIVGGQVLLRNDPDHPDEDRKSTRLNSSHGYISYAVFCLKKKKKT